MPLQMDFLRSLGFTDNPFAHTNADQEQDRLPTYFIPPPYFHDVFGNPEYPDSIFVFAPRGGGKSAQRIMLEKECQEKNVLALTYDSFEFPSVTSAKEVTLEDHIDRIIRFALMGLMVTLTDERQLLGKLTPSDKNILLRLIERYLAHLTEPELENVKDALRSIKEKAVRIWNTFSPVASPLMSTLLRLLGLELNEIGKLDVDRSRTKDSKYDLQLVVNLARKLGFLSIYVLVDRVDESALTGNEVPSTFDLIRPLVKDLGLLEFPGIGFKFFLWDKLLPDYQKLARQDRVKHRVLSWTDEMLQEMWRRRLKAFSNDRIWSLNHICESTEPYNPDKLALIFANGSPRDMIRIGDRVISEQQEVNSNLSVISATAVYRGLEVFCQERLGEVVRNPRTENELRQMGTMSRQVDYTISYLANEVFKENQGSTRNRLMRWRREGLVAEVGRIDVTYSRQKRPVKLIAINDIRVAQVMCASLPITEFLDRKTKSCPNCHTLVLRDWDTDDTMEVCHKCRYSWDTESVDERIQVDLDFDADSATMGAKPIQLKLDFKDDSE